MAGVTCVNAISVWSGGELVTLARFENVGEALQFIESHLQFCGSELARAEPKIFITIETEIKR